MTSQLNVDTIVDKAGSGGTNVKIGNTLLMYLMVVVLHRTLCKGCVRCGGD